MSEECSPLNILNNFIIIYLDIIGYKEGSYISVIKKTEKKKSFFGEKCKTEPQISV
jgi:hypothetical protein